MKKEDLEDIVFEFECFLTELTLVVLKVTEIINWAWFWVLFPVWFLLIVKFLTRNNKK